MAKSELTMTINVSIEPHTLTKMLEFVDSIINFRDRLDVRAAIGDAAGVVLGNIADELTELLIGIEPEGKE